MKVFVIQGKGLDVRGTRDVEIFGPETLEEINAKIRKVSDSLGITVEIFQSNEEADVLAYLASIPQDATALLINPGGFTVAPGGLPAALGALPCPVYEVHGSNPSARGIASVIAPVCQGAICGFGYDGYGLVLQAIANLNTK